MNTKKASVIKLLSLTCMFGLLSACVQKGLVDSEKLTYTEVDSMKADLKLEMIAPPKSKKLSENVITSIEVEPFVVQGEGNKEFAQMINDKIIARIDDGNYVRVVKSDGEAKLSGTLRIGQMEKFQEQASASSEILGGDDGQQMESGSSAASAGNIAAGVLGALGEATAAAAFSPHYANGQKDVAVKKINVKRMSAIITYKLMKGDELIDSGDIKKELNEKQSAYVLSQAAFATENSGQISDPQMTNKLLDIIADSVVAEISPHPQLFPFNWMDSGCSGNDDFDMGLKYAKQNLDSDAESLWKKLEITSKSAECRSAALYNLGLLKLRSDPKSKIKQSEAYHMFVEADGLNRGNDKFIMPAVKKLKRIAFTKFVPLDPSLRNLKVSNFGMYQLEVNATPEESSISILNSREIYKAGMELKPGRYKIKVSAPGYKSKTKEIKIIDKNIKIDIDLDKKH